MVSTRHTTRANVVLFQETFPGRVISLRGDIKIMRFNTMRLFCGAMKINPQHLTT